MIDNRRQRPEIKIINETLQILNDGFYEKENKKIVLPLAKSEAETAKVFLPDDLKQLKKESFDAGAAREPDVFKTGCFNSDSLNAALNLIKTGQNSVAVLNFVNPVHIGGGVYRGARAQEEDLCRKTSLLKSLESKEAFKYYKYNRNLHTYLGSDAVIFSPYVEIFRDAFANLLETPEVCSVITCAAPLVRNGTEGKSRAEYEHLLFNRINGILLSCAYFKCKNLVLGAWGCGAFGNDAAVMAKAFKKALENFKAGEKSASGIFERIVFAVPRSGRNNNYEKFADIFGTYEF